jgi:RNase P/RNase MRP subunit p30
MTLDEHRDVLAVVAFLGAEIRRAQLTLEDAPAQVLDEIERGLQA